MNKDNLRKQLEIDEKLDLLKEHKCCAESILCIETYMYRLEEEITKSKQALNEIRKYCKFDKQNYGHVCYVGGKYEGIKIVCDDILQIIDKVGDSE